MGVTADVVIEEFSSDTPAADKDIPKDVGDIIQRDQWGRPKIKPPGGGRAVGYTRASGLGKILDDDTNITKWKLRSVVAGLAQRPDLVMLASAKLGNKRTLDDVAEQAKEYALAGERANKGTAVHGFVEAAAKGRPVGTIPPEVQRDIDAYHRAMQGWGVAASELFVVCVELQVAGTMDSLLIRPFRLRGGKVVGDLKTGDGIIQYGQQATAVQLAVYAHGEIYDPATGQRTPTGASLVDGYVFWLPLGKGVCEIHRVDLVRGWEAAKRAIAVKEGRKEKGLFTLVGEIDLVDVQKELRRAKTADDVRDTYRRLVRAGNDRAMVEEACRARIANIEKAAKAAERKAEREAAAAQEGEPGGDDE